MASSGDESTQKSNYASGSARILTVIAVNLGIVLFILAAVELTCRFLESRAIHPKQSGQAQPQQPTVDQRLLAQLPAAKSASEFRVIVLGGSTVYGVPVPEIAFVAQLRYWIHRLYPERNIGIYNFGYPGATTADVLNHFRTAMGAQPDLIVVITGHNEFIRPDTDSRLDRIRENLERHSATMRAIQNVVTGMMKYRKSTVMPAQVLPRDRQSASFRNKVALFENELNEIVQTAARSHVKLVVGTLPSNLADWPPIFKRLTGRDQRYTDTVYRIQQLLSEGKSAEAQEAISQGFRQYPDDAMLYYLRGKSQLASGRNSDARISFLKARDLDPVPIRTSSELNSIIRRVASGVPGVSLLDLDKIYDERAKTRPPGFDMFVDNVHGTPYGESITAQALIEQMVRLNILPPAANGPDGCCAPEPFLAEVGYSTAGSPLRLRFLLENATYVMKTPMLFYDISRKYLQEAARLDPNSWEVWANLATVSYLTGDAASGAEQLKMATDLHHGPLDPEDRIKTPYLKEALETARTGKTPDVPCLFASCR